MSAEFNVDSPWLLHSKRMSEAPRSLEVGWIFERTLRPSEEIRNELVERGFEFEQSKAQCEGVLRGVAELLKIIPSLEQVVSLCTRKIFLLKAPAGYDISHSEPRWPDSIFLSVAHGAQQVCELRALESIVHESMHLNLTNFEASANLVADADLKLHSPWKNQPRALLGILHGIYVFYCVTRCYERLLRSVRFDSEGSKYVRNRLEEIREELCTINEAALMSGLTHVGTSLVRCCLRTMKS